ncbi:LacI family DNA-binding transcriptional regulator [Enterococcus bulliens]
MKKITINDVAQKAGVSKTTVSRFLNNNYNNMSDQTKKRIEDVIKELNYRPNKQAQALKSKHSYLIGVVVADISNMFSSLLLKGIGNILEKKDYQMIIMDAANSITREQILLERLIDQNVDAIILQPSSSKSVTYQLLKERGIPVVLVDRDTSPKQWPSVLTNNEEATKILATEIEKKGYEHIVVMSEPLEEVRTRAAHYHVFEQYVHYSNQQLSLVELSQ